MTKAEILRSLADIYEAYPDLDWPSFWSWCKEIHIHLAAADAKVVLRTIGSFEKNYKDDSFEARKPWGDHTLVLKAQRDAVCQKVVTGTREVPETVEPSYYTPERIIPAHTEEIVEWQCDDPILVDKV